MGMPLPVEPCSFVQPGRLYNECVIALPVAHRVPVISWIGCAFLRCAHIRRKRPPVHPDFAPDVLKLNQHHNPAGHRCESKPSNFVNRIARNSKWITGPYRWVVRACRTELRQRLIFLEQLLPKWRQRRLVSSFEIWNSCPRPRPCPRPTQVALGSRPPRSNGSVGGIIFPRRTFVSPLLRPRLSRLGNGNRREHQDCRQTNGYACKWISHFHVSTQV